MYYCYYWGRQGFLGGSFFFPDRVFLSIPGWPQITATYNLGLQVLHLAWYKFSLNGQNFGQLFLSQTEHKWFSLGGLPNSLLDANTVVQTNPQASQLLGKKNKSLYKAEPPTTLPTLSFWRGHQWLPLCSSVTEPPASKGLGSHRNTVVEEAVPYPGPHWPVPSPAGHQSSSPLDHSYCQCPGS